MTGISRFTGYEFVRPFDLFRNFFWIGYVVSAVVFLVGSYFSKYPGYIGAAAVINGSGAAKFLIDSYFIVVFIYVIVIASKLNSDAIKKINSYAAGNESLRHPVLASILFFFGISYILFFKTDYSETLFVRMESFGFLLFWIPIYEYVTACAFSIIICRILRD